MGKRVDRRGNFRRDMRSGRHRPLHQHAAADLHVHFSGPPGNLNVDGLRRGFVLDDESAERRADVAIAFTARRLISTCLENGVDSLAGAGPRRDSAGKRRRKDAVDRNRPDSAGMLPHVCEREIGSVRYSVKVPFCDVQREAQIFESAALSNVLYAPRSEVFAASSRRHLSVASEYALPAAAASAGMSSVSAAQRSTVRTSAAVARYTCRAAT